MAQGNSYQPGGINPQQSGQFGPLVGGGMLAIPSQFQPQQEQPLEILGRLNKLNAAADTINGHADFVAEKIGIGFPSGAPEVAPAPPPEFQNLDAAIRELASALTRAENKLARITRSL